MTKVSDACWEIDRISDGLYAVTVDMSYENLKAYRERYAEWVRKENDYSMGMSYPGGGGSGGGTKPEMPVVPDTNVIHIAQLRLTGIFQNPPTPYHGIFAGRALKKSKEELRERFGRKAMLRVFAHDHPHICALAAVAAIGGATGLVHLISK